MEAAGQSWKKRVNIVGLVYITQTGRYLKAIGGRRSTVTTGCRVWTSTWASVAGWEDVDIWSWGIADSVSDCAR